MGAKAENETHVSFSFSHAQRQHSHFAPSSNAALCVHDTTDELRPDCVCRSGDSERFNSLVHDKPAVQVEGDNALSAELNDGAMPISMSIWMCELRHRSARTSDAPVCWLRWQARNVLKRGAIHDPDTARASNGILPNNVRLAVPVKIARTSDAPVCWLRWQARNVLKRGAIHDPDTARASNGILPNNIRLAVPVKVARTSDAPGCWLRWQARNVLKRGAIHDPDYRARQ